MFQIFNCQEKKEIYLPLEDSKSYFQDLKQSKDIHPLPWRLPLCSYA